MELSITDLNKNLSYYLERSQHEDVVITKHGKPIAILVGAARHHQQGPKNLAEALAALGGADVDWELPGREPWQPRELF